SPFVSSGSVHLRDLHSFPTRRSSDLTPPVDRSFWPDAIAAVRAKKPDFVFMAEVYWDLEWTLQRLGFDYTYDKRLYDIKTKSGRSEEHTSELQSRENLVCRLLLEKKK